MSGVAGYNAFQSGRILALSGLPAFALMPVLPRILRFTGLVETVGVPGTLLGTLPEIASEDRDARLAPGDALVLYTDGLTESGAPRVWTPSQLDSAVAGARRMNAQGIVEHLAAQARAPLRDDLALLAIRVHPLL